MRTNANSNHLTHIIVGFLNDRRSSRLSPRTIQFYEDELRAFIAGVGDLELLAVTPDVIRAHLLDLSSTRNAGGIHARFRAIRCFLNWCWQEYELDERNPISRVKPPKVQTAPLPGISIADIMKMVSVCSFARNGARDTAILLCLLDTGARRSEFVALNWSDVNLITGDVRIKSGKGDKPRMVHVGKRATKALRAWSRLAPLTDPLWTSESQERLTVAGLREIVRRRASDVGIPAPGLHDFRRACMLAMLRNGADVISVSRYAGHSDVRVTMRYLAQTNDDMHNCHVKTSPVDCW
jgi:integrase/recombinase XerD